ncbi:MULTISPECIES: hypothetical protein [unclassified Streptomyces]|uniref:hypothetical protein n=1 Tax=unclassified Streptomyces TaxID=2593676 RepID=UPI001F325189|nr:MULTISPECIES: hypothetical protein [unclassified Streptomyces]
MSTETTVIPMCCTVASVNSWLRERRYSPQIQSFVARQFAPAIRPPPPDSL